MKNITRRDAMQVMAAGAATLAARDAFAQGTIAELSPSDKQLLRSIENSPWVASAGNPARPVYVLWAPWCPYCVQLMKDTVAGHHQDIQLRWIGAGPTNDSHKLLIAAVARAGDETTLRKVVLREPVEAEPVDTAFVDRAATSELLLYRLNTLKKARGYPTFSYFNGQAVATHSGYGQPESIASLKSAAVATTTTKPDTSYLTEAWKDLGPASGKPYSNANGYVIYSLPSELSVIVNVVEKGRFWPMPTKKMIGIKNQKWASVSTGVSFGNRPALDGYIRLG